GQSFLRSSHGLVTSLAWGRSGRVDYVLEGNINYSGAVITWLMEVGLLQSPLESSALAKTANPADTTILVPAFTGLGAPYWNAEARAAFVGMSRTTGRAELVRAGLEAIAYQVSDIVEAVGQDTGLTLAELRVDGGPTANAYLMQFQSDMSGAVIRVPKAEDLSAIGAATMAGIAAGIYDESLLNSEKTNSVYVPYMDEEIKTKKLSGWKEAVRTVNKLSC
ncbi:MAG: glycerol kinase, partial [Lachnospiraceae bacterium]|nr:glycerol kinase [Lachnospiraceae bacterium]